MSTKKISQKNQVGSNPHSLLSPYVPPVPIALLLLRVFLPPFCTPIIHVCEQVCPCRAATRACSCMIVTKSSKITSQKNLHEFLWFFPKMVEDSVINKIFPPFFFSPSTVHFYTSIYRKDFSACVCQDVFSHDSYFVTIVQLHALVAAPQGETCSQT